jgi:hypothetical protein
VNVTAFRLLIRLSRTIEIGPLGPDDVSFERSSRQLQALPPGHSLDFQPNDQKSGNLSGAE